MKLKIDPVIVVVEIEEGHRLQRAAGQGGLLMGEISNYVLDLVEQGTIVVETNLIVRMCRYKIEQMIL